MFRCRIFNNLSDQIGVSVKSKLFAAAAIMMAAVSQSSLAQDAVAPGDAAHGAIVFKQCLVCHTNEEGKNKIGPSLWAVVGRHSASIANYQYSTAMKAADKTWDDATLNVYLTKPQAMVPGTKMTFPGLAKDQDRADVIAYLNTLK
jgi:cytochrome c